MTSIGRYHDWHETVDFFGLDQLAVEVVIRMDDVGCIAETAAWEKPSSGQTIRKVQRSL